MPSTVCTSAGRSSSAGFPVRRGRTCSPDTRPRKSSISSNLRRPSSSSASVSSAKSLGSRARSQPRRKRNAPLCATSRPRKISITWWRMARGRSSSVIEPDWTKSCPMRRPSAASRCDFKSWRTRARSARPMRQATSPSFSPGLAEHAHATFPSISATARSVPPLRASSTPSRRPLWRKFSRSAGGNVARSPASTAPAVPKERTSARRPGAPSCSAMSRSGTESSTAKRAPPRSTDGSAAGDLLRVTAEPSRSARRLLPPGPVSTLLLPAVASLVDERLVLPPFQLVLDRPLEELQLHRQHVLAAVDEHGGGRLHPRADPLLQVALDRALEAAGVDLLEHLRAVEPELLGVALEVLVAQLVLVGEEQIVHRPELALAAGVLGAAGGDARARVAGEREELRAQSRLALLGAGDEVVQRLVGDRAMRAF